MEILNQFNSKARKRERLVVLLFLRSSQNRCIEGYCVSMHRCNTKTGEVTKGSLNIFGEGMYSKELAKKFYKAVYNCVLATQKYYSELTEKNNRVPEFWDILDAELEDVWCSIDGNGVPGDIKDLDSVYSFIKRWDR